MGLIASQEERNLTWSEMSGLLRWLTLLVVVEAIVMGVGIAFGVDTENNRSIISFVRALMGEGEVISESWLWVARLMVPALVVTVIVMRREGARLVRERRQVAGEQEMGLTS